MRLLFNKYILSVKEFNELKHKDSLLKELKTIIKDTEIQKEIVKLEKKYKKYIGKWYQSEDNIVFKIERIKYNKSYLSDFVFEVSAPNIEDWFDINILDIVSNDYVAIPENKVIELLGV